jgi:hypothetical protein
MLVLVPRVLLESSHADNPTAFRLLSTIICKQIQQSHKRRAKRGKRGRPHTKREVFAMFAGIHSDALKDIDRNGYVRACQSLVQDGIIEVNHKYSSARFPKGYRLGVAFHDEPLTLSALPFLLHKKEIYGNVKEWSGPHREEYVFAESCLARFSLPRWEVERFNQICDAKESNPHAWPDYSRFSIVTASQGRWWSKICKNHRHHTPLTILDREVRQHLRYDFCEPVCGWDFKNFQPALLVLYRRWGVSRRVPAVEESCFASLCREGILYEFFLEEMGKDSPYSSRDEVKVDLLRLLNKTNESMAKMPLFRCLSRCFPVMAEVIAEVKRHDHRQMARFLQTTEANIVFGGVVGRFRRKYDGPFFTVHDSVITTTDFSQQLKEVFLEVIEEEGIPTRVGAA